MSRIKCAENQRAVLRPGLATCGHWTLIAFWLSVLVQSPAALAQPALDTAIEKLVAEAAELDELEAPKNPPVFTRPHPALVGVGGDLAPAVLDRMSGKFTGNEYRDTYIRWHLMEIIKRSDEGAPGSLRREAPRIIKLINSMPGPLQLPLLQEWKDEPEEISRQYHALLHQTRVVVGYPPFERVYYGDQAVPHMDPQRRAKVAPILKELERLRPMWKRILDQKAITRNDRVSRVNWIVRQYRGELVYALLLTGDPSVPERAVQAVGRAVQKKDRAAFDILSFMYLAAFNGVLDRYPSDSLRGVGQSLESVARTAEAYALYRDGEFEIPKWAPRHERSFADYAFHLVHMLKDEPARYVGRAGAAGYTEPPESPAAWAPYTNEAETSGLKPEDAARAPVKPEDLSIELIRQATQMAVDALYRVEPRYTFPDEHRLHRIWHSGRWGAHPVWQETIHEMGNHALACWALLSAGESYQNPRIRRRLNWVLSEDAPFTYDRGMRAHMLAQMPHQVWAPWVRRESLWFSGAITAAGNFDYQWIGPAIEGPGDHANGQYGVLGLWGLQQAEYPVSDKAWQTIDAYWRGAQNKETGGWAAVAPDDKNTQAGVQKTKTSGPMTAGGVMVLSLTDRYLRGRSYVDVPAGQPPASLTRGLEWLDKNFSMTDQSEASDFFYYMWTIQSVGHASGYRTFNGLDWYRQVTARLLSLQRKDGTWVGSKGTVLSTGFALLYLARANAPLAVAKVRFDGSWNNRPHDLLNFVEWASDEYEVPLFWQIADPQQPLHELIEARMLYLASDGQISLNAEQVDGLRRYIEAGGLLVLVPEGSNRAAFVNSSAKLAQDLFGSGAKFDALPPDHALYNLHHRAASVKLAAVSNGVRPLIVRFQTDVARDLQTRDMSRPDAFHAMSNLYLFVTGKDFARPRLDTNHVPQRNSSPKSKLLAARIRHGGTFDPEPHATRRLATILANHHDLDFKMDVLDPKDLGESHRIAFLTVTPDASVDEAQAAALKRWIEAGGTLWIDAAGGGLDAGQKADEILQQIWPEARRKAMPVQHPILSGQGLAGGYDNRNVSYRKMFVQKAGPVSRARLTHIEHNGRVAIVFSGEDLIGGLAGLMHWDIFGYTPDSATQLIINGLLSATGAPGNLAAGEAEAPAKNNP
jgi:hypothetical protein